MIHPCKFGHTHFVKPTISALTIFTWSQVTLADTNAPLSDFASDVVRHVLLHEIGHAAIREFKLPVLANEEAMADSFANVALTQYRRDEALRIMTARIKSWMLEDQEVSPEDYDLKGEHDLDLRRAYQTACILLGSDPAEWADDLSWIEFSDRDAAACADTAPDQIEGWAKVLSPHFGASASNNVVVQYGESPMTGAMMRAGIFEEIAELANVLDWPNPIYLHFDHCSSGAWWSRSTRTVTLCDNYVQRFVKQGKTLDSM